MGLPERVPAAILYVLPVAHVAWMGLQGEELGLAEVSGRLLLLKITYYLLLNDPSINEYKFL